jgi:tetratricopeptide (TPR) repeat protein
MGGIGKTELALQYAYKHLDLQTYPGSVCWLRARQEVGTQIVSFAQTHLGLAPSEDLELLDKVTVCWQQWRDGDVLVVFDDVQSYAEIQPFLPPGRSRFKVLLTTRLTLQSPVQKFEIKVLSEEKALELLRAIVTDGRIDQDLETAKQICHWLGYLPLGLELVGRYLVWDEDVTLPILWQRLQEKRTDAIALKQTYPGMTASEGVAAAFELSWRTLTPPAQQLASLLSLFALAEIPWALVEACLPEVDAEELQRLRTSELVGLHLLERTGKGMYQLHQLLREFFAAKRSQMADTADIEQAFRSAVLWAAKRSTETPKRSLTAETTVLIPHLQAAVEMSETLNHETDLALDLEWLAKLYYSQGRYAEAEPPLTRVRTVRESQLGIDHSDVAASLNDLAEIYRAQGRYPEAEPLYNRALAILERVLGSDHYDVAICLNNLAELYQAQGRYPEAEPLYNRALAILERVLGSDHYDVAICLNNLANLYNSRGYYAKQNRSIPAHSTHWNAI